VVGEVPEDLEVVATWFALGELSAQQMAKIAERELLKDPDDKSWLDVAIIREDVREVLAGPFAAALARHDAPVPDEKGALGFLTRRQAREGLRAGEDPLKIANALIEQFYFSGYGDLLPEHLWRLYHHLDEWGLSHDKYVEQVREELQRLAVGEPATVQVGPYWWEQGPGETLDDWLRNLQKKWSKWISGQ